jgi:poly-beta-1,6-N-acetyl-D-glucosamine synthase
VLRWWVPLFLSAAFLLNIALLEDGWIYRVGLAVQIAFYGLAALGYLLRRRPALPRLLAVPLYFTMVNIASARGIIEAYTGKTYTTWTTARARTP